MSAPSPRDFYASYVINIAGSPLPQAKADSVLSFEVERNLYLPASFCIKFSDGGPGGALGPVTLSLANDTSFAQIGSAIEILAGYGETPVSVFKGEITSVELDISGTGDMPCFLIRGYDKGHRLQRGRVSSTYLNVKDTDVLSTIAGAAGLSASTDETTEVFDTISQNNQTYWEFLVARAQRIGYEMFMDDGTLHFRKPALTGSPVITSTLWEDLIWLNLRLSSSGQVAAVNVQAWDPQQKQAILGTASTPDQLVSVSDLQGGSTLSTPFGTANMVLSNRLVHSQDDATSIAQAALNELTDNSLQIEGEMKGNPALKPGTLLTLANLGTRFNGNYYVTSVTHRVGQGGQYTTRFTVTGRRSNTLGELVGMAAGATWNGNGHGANQAPVIGVVTDNTDSDKKQGRVKVKLPYIAGASGESGGIVTDWARLVVPGGGATRGMYYLPEVNDEVLVAFEQGDINRPYILGGLWNGTDAPPKGNDKVADSTGVNQRIIQSRTGHIITLDDTNAKQMITVVTQGGHKLTMDDTDGSPNITILDSSGNNKIVIDTTSNKITITAQGNIELNATQDVKITGQNITLTAQQALNMEAQGGAATMKGVSTSIEAQTSGAVKATAQLSLQGTAGVQVSSPSSVQVSGNPIMLN
ncbi:MAG TPA: VgrG-related protein [Chloroflexota bacterium]|nr:VgrG-related protein [Chloroflexota bacterium]